MSYQKNLHRYQNSCMVELFDDQVFLNEPMGSFNLD